MNRSKDPARCAAVGSTDRAPHHLKTDRAGSRDARPPPAYEKWSWYTPHANRSISGAGSWCSLVSTLDCQSLPGLRDHASPPSTPSEIAHFDDTATALDGARPLTWGHNPGHNRVACRFPR